MLIDLMTFAFATLAFANVESLASFSPRAATVLRRHTRSAPRR
ncbi:MAG: hypothetical protein ACM30I_18710 [Gemmatimonas sp.]